MLSELGKFNYLFGKARRRRRRILLGSSIDPNEYTYLPRWRQTMIYHPYFILRTDTVRGEGARLLGCCLRVLIDYAGRALPSSNGRIATLSPPKPMNVALERALHKNAQFGSANRLAAREKNCCSD